MVLKIKNYILFQEHKTKIEKLLYKYFGIIKTFAQDVFGNDVELDFQKEEPSEAKTEQLENTNDISNNQVLKEEESSSKEESKEESKQEDDS
ncbi:MAG: hypothetical protein U5K55_05930, partial [Aliarcobacter sp.]|nr:hypothetical protein [Aliarcobacter sp.]